VAFALVALSDIRRILTAGWSSWRRTTGGG